MNLLEIVLIIIGIIIIIISCLLVDNSSDESVSMVVQPFSFDQNISEEDRKKIISKLQELLSEMSEETIVRTDDVLSKISNEKIMAVSEYSDQILEKINRNHEEVVFLYNMLNDKEKEIKATVKEIDLYKKNILKNVEIKDSEGLRKTVDPSNKSRLGKKSISEGNLIETMSMTNDDQTVSATDQEVTENTKTNNNKQILSLYSSGKSVMEISKQLGLGQGEVKLVIDLYNSKK